MNFSGDHDTDSQVDSQIHVRQSKWAELFFVFWLRFYTNNCLLSMGFHPTVRLLRSLHNLYRVAQG